MSDKQPSDQELVEKVKELIETRSLSQQAISQRIGYSAATINQWLQNKYPGRTDLVEQELRLWIATLDKSSDLQIVKASVGIDLFAVYLVKNRPWVASGDICLKLGIDASRQYRRLLRHEKLNRLQILHLDNVDSPLLPLEMVTWFLMTLRPKGDAAKKRDRYIDTMYWSFRTALDHRSTVVLKDIILANRKPHKKGPYKTRGITEEQIKELMALVESEPKLSYGEIAYRLGLSKSVVWKVLNGGLVVGL